MKLRVSQNRKNFVIVAVSVIGAFIVSACSKQPAAPPAPATSLVEQSAADAEGVRIEEFHGRFAPGGIAASYRATFSDGRIKMLEETRERRAQTGVYEFRGARLMKYRGAALGSDANVELQFDLQGKVLVARAGDKRVSAEEITAIRDRAQSLRSHAVAQHSVRGHESQ